MGCCKECQNRHPGCHDKCRDYKVERIYNAVVKAKEVKEKEAYNERIRRSIEITERQRRHGR